MTSETSTLDPKYLKRKHVITKEFLTEDNLKEEDMLRKKLRTSDHKEIPMVDISSSDSSSEETLPENDERDLYGSVTKISSDCKQKLTQITFTANQFSRHCHREKLMSEDFKKSLKFYSLDDDSEDSKSSDNETDTKPSDNDESIPFTCRDTLFKCNVKLK